jgi:hypothetical protein
MVIKQASFLIASGWVAIAVVAAGFALLAAYGCVALMAR